MKLSQNGWIQKLQLPVEMLWLKLSMRGCLTGKLFSLEHLIEDYSVGTLLSNTGYFVQVCIATCSGLFCSASL